MGNGNANLSFDFCGTKMSGSARYRGFLRENPDYFKGWIGRIRARAGALLVRGWFTVRSPSVRIVVQEKS